MKDFRLYIHQTITLLKRPLVMVILGLLSLVFFLIATLAILDYQTNFIATRLGKLLVVSNRLRPQVGNIWQRIEAQTRTKKNIDKNETLSLNDIQKGLPDPIRHNRFESEQIPDSGIPSYVSIWQTPMPNTNINDRSLNDIITSRRIYQRGLAIINALILPDVHFHNQVRARLEHLYTQFDDLNTVATDTLIVADGDTLDALAPEALKTAVFNELAIEMIPTLREKEQKAFLKNYQEGHIVQLFLYRDLGQYRGEFYRDNAPETPIPFVISTQAVANIFHFEYADSLQTDPITP